MSDSCNNDIWVFLSHSNKDYEKVIKVRDLLEKNSFRPLMFFLKCLNDDEEIDDLIKREIDSRGRFILCDSENARNSKWVQREVEYIKNKQRIYQTIDIDDTDENIARDILQFKKDSIAYISYSQEDFLLFEQLADMLKRDWDFYVNDLPLFISYKSEDESIHNQFCNQLSFSDWRIDVRELRYIKQKIYKAIAEGYVFFIITRHFMKSQSCIEELKYAYKHRKKGNVVILMSDVDNDSIRAVIPDYNYFTAIPFSITENGHMSVNILKLYFTFMGDLISDRAKSGDVQAQKWQIEYAEDFYETGMRLYYDDRPYENIEKAAYCNLRYAADLGHKKAQEMLHSAYWDIDTEKTWDEHKEYMKKNNR